MKLVLILSLILGTQAAIILALAYVEAILDERRRARFKKYLQALQETAPSQEPEAPETPLANGDTAAFSFFVESKERTFRATRWGMRPNEILALEGAVPYYTGSEHPLFGVAHETQICYQESIEGKDCLLSYYFVEDALRAAGYVFASPTNEEEAHWQHVQLLESLLTTKYGEPMIPVPPPEVAHVHVEVNDEDLPEPEVEDGPEPVGEEKAEFYLRQWDTEFSRIRLRVLRDQEQWQSVLFYLDAGHDQEPESWGGERGSLDKL